LTKAIALRAIAVGSRAQFEATNRAIEVNRLKPVIDRVFSFDEAIDAYHHYEDAAPLARL
jgi:NADPH:quinone reductase-like Zn-dependent oxidoreductase